MKRLVLLRSVLLAVLMWSAFSVASWAQGNYRTVLFVHVKMDQQDNWKASVKDLVALHKKAGVEDPFTVWESQTGPNQYAVVWYSKTFGDMDKDDPKLKNYDSERKAIFAKLNGYTISLDHWIDEMQPDLWIRGANVPAMVRTGRTRVIPGKMDELTALFKEQLMPALKKGGVTDFGMAEGRFGTNGNEIHSYFGMSHMADLDGTGAAKKAMGDDAYKAFIAKVTMLTEGTAWDLWKFQPDLSYVPAAGMK